MSDIVKNSTSFRKRAQQDSILPSPGNKTLVFHTQAAGGETSITLSSLTVPTILPGYANPSLSDMLGSRLSLYPGSMTLISSLNGILMPDVTWKCNTPSVITFLGYTLTSGEIITGIIRPVNTDGVLVTDARALAVTGVLAAGQDTIVTAPFTVNKYSNAQVGDVLVYFNGQLQFRNTGNATAAPSADGNYQEVPVAGGLTNQIKANSPVGVDTPYMIISNGLVAERPTNSLMAAIEAVQGKVDAMIPDLAALAGVPTTNYSTQTPTNVDLASFGNQILSLGTRVTALEATKYFIDAFSTAGQTVNSSPTVVYGTIVSDNTGGAYNTSTGVFTAPRDDYYFFSPTVHATINIPTTGALGVRLLKNESGSPVSIAENSLPGSGSSATHGRSITKGVFLSAGETMTIKVDSTTAGNLTAARMDNTLQIWTR